MSTLFIGRKNVRRKNVPVPLKVPPSFLRSIKYVSSLQLAPNEHYEPQGISIIHATPFILSLLKDAFYLQVEEYIGNELSPCYDYHVNNSIHVGWIRQLIKAW